MPDYTLTVLLPFYGTWALGTLAMTMYLTRKAR